MPVEHKERSGQRDVSSRTRPHGLHMWPASEYRGAPGSQERLLYYACAAAGLTAAGTAVWWLTKESYYSYVPIKVRGARRFLIYFIRGMACPVGDGRVRVMDGRVHGFFPS